MRALYLIRHATPLIQPNDHASLWPLSEQGIAEAERLGELAATWDLRALYTSVERKAQTTGLIIGEHARLPALTVDGLQELRFDTWIANADEFAEAVRAILADPAASVRGAEGAAKAAARFAAGVEIINDGEAPAALVSHGRVLAAYLGTIGAVEDAFELWRSIPMPGWAVLDVDTSKLVEPFRGLP